MSSEYGHPISFRLPDELLERLRDHADNEGLHLSELIRNVVADHLDTSVMDEENRMYRNVRLSPRLAKVIREEAESIGISMGELVHEVLKREFE
jgi:predicted HicB family RNase H-like nuclease